MLNCLCAYNWHELLVCHTSCHVHCDVADPFMGVDDGLVHMDVVDPFKGVND